MPSQRTQETPTNRFHPWRGTTARQEKERCPICLDDFTKVYGRQISDCNHYACGVCIGPIIQTGCCPICRNVVDREAHQATLQETRRHYSESGAMVIEEEFNPGNEEPWGNPRIEFGPALSAIDRFL